MEEYKFSHHNYFYIWVKSRKLMDRKYRILATKAMASITLGAFIGGFVGQALIKNGHVPKPTTVIPKIAPYEMKTVAVQEEVGGLEEITEANKLLREFPTEIPGAINVKKYEVPGALQTFVHIQQRHYVDPNNLRSELMKERDSSEIGKLLFTLGPEQQKLFTRAGYNMTENVQKNIGLIFTNLGVTMGINSVRAEGVSRENFSRVDALANLVHRLNQLEKSGIYEPNEIGGEVYWAAGSEFVLGFGAGLKLLPASSDVIEQGLNGPDRQRIIYEPRENYVVGLVGQSTDPICLVLYGAGHDFKNNVDQWNFDNPGDKMSLIEVEPSMGDPDEKIKVEIEKAPKFSDYFPIADPSEIPVAPARHPQIL